MTNRPDHYATLGVPPSATPAEITHAYHALLHRHHPDTRPQHDETQTVVSDTALQQVLAAYTVLHNPTRRADYDRQISPPTHQPRRRQQPPNRYGENAQPPIIAGPVRWHQPH